MMTVGMPHFDSESLDRAGAILVTGVPTMGVNRNGWMLSNSSTNGVALTDDLLTHFKLICA